ATGRVPVSEERLLASAAQTIVRVNATVWWVNQRRCHQAEPLEGHFFCLPKIGFAKLADRFAIDIPVPAMPFALTPNGECSQSISERKGAILFLGQPAIPPLRADNDRRMLIGFPIWHQKEMVTDHWERL